MCLLMISGMKHADTPSLSEVGQIPISHFVPFKNVLTVCHIKLNEI